MCATPVRSDSLTPHLDLFFGLVNTLDKAKRWFRALWGFWYTAMLAGLTILLTNLIRTLWQFVRSRKLIRGRLQI